jgi:hypothetical protein
MFFFFQEHVVQARILLRGSRVQTNNREQLWHNKKKTPETSTKQHADTSATKKKKSKTRTKKARRL